MFSELVKATRSYRNFDPAVRLTDEQLSSLIELCRFTPSTANSQSIKFAYANSEEACEKVFSILGWAGYLTDKPPYDGNVPAAYILVCYDTSICKEIEIDAGICAQTIVLGAMDMG
ncbi:MAG: nitroreductase family protein, partial [Clostridia bacterium]|nr:nitroreductase family protein [Clostridia bacterium]